MPAATVRSARRMRLLREPNVQCHITSVLLGASSVKQLSEDLGALNNTTFSTEELAAIDQLSKPIQITDRV